MSDLNTLSIQQLKNILKKDFNIEVTGKNKQELIQLINSHPEKNQETTDQKEIPVVTVKNQTVQKGKMVCDGNVCRLQEEPTKKKVEYEGKSASLNEGKKQVQKQSCGMPAIIALAFCGAFASTVTYAISQLGKKK
ncbi:Hypothetical_protein [Hexamita inflata]|uniref:Hypothetical_protein n=1 Tax=Hexamita inflata TaxID=28002 RepID=A0AA86NXI0_9EUKA|nr:Hypothetical protein HINF_LOCUS15478 [Hexamita inflata]